MNKKIDTDNQIYDGRFHHPARILLNGKSGAGKTHFTINLIKEIPGIFDTGFDHIYWFYGTESPFRGKNPLIDIKNISYVMNNDVKIHDSNDNCFQKVSISPRSVD